MLSFHRAQESDKEEVGVVREPDRAQSIVN